MDTNYYSALGVPRDATEEDIKKAYRRKSLQYHPDKNKDRDTTSQFQSVARAFEVLSDSRKRVFHDIDLRQREGGEETADEKLRRRKEVEKEMRRKTTPLNKKSRRPFSDSSNRPSPSPSPYPPTSEFSQSKSSADRAQHPRQNEFLSSMKGSTPMFKAGKVDPGSKRYSHDCSAGKQEDLSASTPPASSTPLPDQITGDNPKCTPIPSLPSIFVSAPISPSAFTPANTDSDSSGSFASTKPSFGVDTSTPFRHDQTFASLDTNLTSDMETPPSQSPQPGYQYKGEDQTDDNAHNANSNRGGNPANNLKGAQSQRSSFDEEIVVPFWLKDLINSGIVDEEKESTSEPCDGKVNVVSEVATKLFTSAVNAVGGGQEGASKCSTSSPASEGTYNCGPIVQELIETESEPEVVKMQELPKDQSGATQKEEVAAEKPKVIQKEGTSACELKTGKTKSSQDIVTIFRPIVYEFDLSKHASMPEPEQADSRQTYHGNSTPEADYMFATLFGLCPSDCEQGAKFKEPLTTRKKGSSDAATSTTTQSSSDYPPISSEPKTWALNKAKKAIQSTGEKAKDFGCKAIRGVRYDKEKAAQKQQDSEATIDPVGDEGLGAEDSQERALPVWERYIWG